jgi:tetratricopeptide (TPR) repeat protein
MNRAPILLKFVVAILALALIFSVFRSLSAAQVAGDTSKILVPDKESEKQPVGRKETVNAVGEKAAYWFNKGALCATYGNDRAAIEFFEKAITLDPQRSDAYFEQGISYGQLGDYQKALILINKSIQMEPQNGLYYYGRGRVYLLAGEKEKAMQDFKKAATLGNEDAIDYLNYIVQR